MLKKIFMIQFLILFSYQTDNEFKCNNLCSNENLSLSHCFCNGCYLLDDCCQNKPKPAKPSLYGCNTVMYDDYLIYTIGRCPDDFPSNKLRKDCESSTELIGKTPVYSKESGDFYKNIFCAKCNIMNLKLNKLSIFIAVVGTSNYNSTFDNKTIGNILNGDTFYDTRFYEPDSAEKPIPCRKLIDSCPLNYPNQTIENFCKNHTALSYNFRSVYKNQYCAICNGVTTRSCNFIFTSKAFIQSLQILFDLSEQNGQIYLSTNVSKLEKNEFVFNNEQKIDHFNSGSMYCQSSKSNSNLKADLAKKYATLIGHAISIVSLVILLAFYFTNKNLRNLPGKILMNLSISLLFSQVLFIISTYYTYSLLDKIFGSTDDKCFLSELKNEFNNVKDMLSHVKLIIPCFISGILTHYFYLVFFLWSNIMAFDLFKMFTKKSPNNIQNDSKLFLKYLIIAWLLPTLLITILLVKNYQKLSYGFYQCFISTNLDLLIFFVVPIVVILSMNLVFLVVSIKTVASVDLLKKKYIANPAPIISFSGSKLTQDQNLLKKRLVLFLKLFILTGMTWIIGIVSALINDRYSFMWYVYIILNSLQGLFIFCSYSFNENSNTNIKEIFLKIFNCFKLRQTFSVRSKSSLKTNTS